MNGLVWVKLHSMLLWLPSLLLRMQTNVFKIALQLFSSEVSIKLVHESARINKIWKAMPLIIVYFGYFLGECEQKLFKIQVDSFSRWISDRRCSNYILIINQYIVKKNKPFFSFTVDIANFCRKWLNIYNQEFHLGASLLSEFSWVPTLWWCRKCVGTYTRQKVFRVGLTNSDWSVILVSVTRT